jgi:hypothetical protein
MRQAISDDGEKHVRRNQQRPPALFWRCRLNRCPTQLGVFGSPKAFAKAVVDVDQL